MGANIRIFNKFRCSLFLASGTAGAAASAHRKSYYSWAQRYALYPVCVHIREYFSHDLVGTIDIGIDALAIVCQEQAAMNPA